MKNPNLPIPAMSDPTITDADIANAVRALAQESVRTSWVYKVYDLASIHSAKRQLSERNQ